MSKPAAPIAGILPNSKQAWSEYTADNGKKYYHNKVTGVTTWDKPLELKTVAEIAATPTTWKEHIADSGRKYYYNTITRESVWDEPAELKAIREAQQQLKQQQQQQQQHTMAYSPGQLSSPDQFKSPIDDKRSASIDQSSERNQEERLESFKKLLEEAGVSITWTWDMAMRAVINDERWKLLKTLNEKKQAFHDFQQEKRKQEREEKRKREERARENFHQMLRECEHLKTRMPWKKAVAYFEGDNRLQAVPEREREDLFEEFFFLLEKQQKDAARQARKENMRNLRIKFEEDSTVNSMTQWRTIKEKYQDDPIFQQLEKNDRLTVFEGNLAYRIIEAISCVFYLYLVVVDYIRDLERIETEKKYQEQQRQKRSARLTRDAYRALLMEKYREGHLNLDTKWKDFYETIKDDPRYKAMVEPTQTGSLPSELFSDFLEELEERFQKEKRRAKEMLEDIRFAITPITTLEDFIAALSKHPKFELLQAKNFAMLHEQFVERAIREEKRKEKEEEHRRRKTEQKFFDVLDDLHVKSGSKWEAVRTSLMERDVFQKILSEDDAQRLFKEYISKNSADSSEEEGTIKTQEMVAEKKSKHKKHKSSHRKHRHHKHRHSSDSDNSESEDKPNKKKAKHDSAEKNETSRGSQ